MNRKIDIYHKGQYICSTTKYKTCKEAKEGFLKNPTYASMPFQVTIDDCKENDIKCRFAM